MNTKDWPLKASEHPKFLPAPERSEQNLILQSIDAEFDSDLFKDIVPLTVEQYEHAALVIKKQEEFEEENNALTIKLLKVSGECIGLQKELAELKAKLAGGIRIHADEQTDYSWLCIKHASPSKCNSILILDNPQENK